MKRARLTRITAFLLATVLLVTGLPQQDQAAEPEPASARSASGISLTLEWDPESPYTDGNTFQMATDSAAWVNTVMKVSYSSKKVREEGYKAGELAITVDGLSSAYRSGTADCVIGADPASETEKTRDWSYTYNRKNDTYTFTNNREIQPGSVFSGYFELVFSMDPRRCTDLYEKEVTAALLLPDGSSVSAKPLAFAADTVTDTYTTGIEAQYLFSTHGLSVENPDSYFWRKYPLDGERVEHSRGVKNGETYELTVPEGAKVYSPYLSVSKIDATHYEVGLETGSGDSNDLVYILYPKETFANKEATVTLSAYGTYWEGRDGEGVEEEVLLASSEASTTFPGASDFDFRLPDGGGDGGRVWKDDSYAGLGKYGADVLGSTMTDGHTETWKIKSSLTAYPDNPTSLQIIDDFQYIQLTDGSWRQLTEADYEHTAIHLPGCGSIINVNNMPLTPDVYGVRIYAARNGAVMEETESTLVFSGVLTNEAQTISLPAGTTAVSIRFDDVEEIVQTLPLTLDTSYHIQDDGGENLNTGQVRNTLLMRFYDKDGNWVEESMATEDNYVDDTNLNLAQKDLDTYGHYQIRSDARITFYGEDSFQSDFVATTGLEPFTVRDDQFTSTLSFGARFDMDEGQRFDRFSLYTMLPKGLKLAGGSDTVEKLWNEIHFSGLGLSEEALVDHAQLELVEDDQGSGQTYLAVHFDVTDLDVDFSKGIAASLDVYAERTWYQKNGVSFQIRSVCMVDEGDRYRGSAKYRDDGAYSDNQALWSDIDRDGVTDEWLSFSTAYRSIAYAASSQFEMNKWIESKYSDGMVQSPDVAEIGLGETYTYTLRLINGANSANDITVYDNLENGDGSQWQGTLQSVDVSDAEAAGLTAEVWYSKDRNAVSMETGDWSQSLDPKEAASVAIVMTGELKAGAVLDLTLKMQAPEDGSFKGEQTENRYRASFTMVDKESGVATVMDKLESNDTLGQLVAGYKDITVRKADEVNESALEGASFQLVDPDTGDVVAEAASNAKGYAVFERVPQDQTYLLKEVAAPDGYDLAEDRVINLDDKDISLTFEDPRVKGTVELHKENALDGDIKVGGASYTIYNSAGEAVGTFETGKDGSVTIEDLDWDQYTIRETDAPEGYEQDPDPYTFEVNRGNATKTQTIYLNDDQIYTSVELTKYEADTAGETLTSTVSGALFDLYRVKDGEPKLMGTYVTDARGSIFVDELPFGDYYFKEKRAPEGYQISEEAIGFTITPKAPDAAVTSANTRRSGSIRLFKLDDAGTPVAGGVYQLSKEDGTVLGEYTTNENGYVDIPGLEWGTYFLQETKAPDGYLLDETRHEATINQSHINVEVRSIEERKLGSVILTKYEETGTQTLSGARFDLYQTDGTQVRTDLVTDEQGRIQVDGLPWGSYYFQEVEAPAGYGLNDEPVRFSVNALTAGSIQQVSLKDPVDARVITVTKRIPKDEINFANGNPSFIFCMTGYDVNGAEHEYNRIVTFTESDLEGGDETYVSKSVTFSGFTAGTYMVTEEETSRFELEGITDVEAGVTDGKMAIFDMVAYDEGSCVFTNRSYESQYYSHASGLSNILKEQSVMTGITVLYDGPDTLPSGSKIDRSMLRVYANYDDGTSVKLPDDLYELSVDTVPQVGGDYTVDVSYTDEDGREATGSFTFRVDLTIIPIGMEATSPNEVYPGQFPISSGDLDYQIVFNNGEKMPITDAEFYEVTIGDRNPEGYPAQDTPCYVLENTTGTQEVPYSVSIVVDGESYTFEGTFEIDTVHTIGLPKEYAIGTWDDTNLTANNAVYVTDSYDGYVFGAGTDEHKSKKLSSETLRQKLRTVTFEVGFSMKYMDFMFMECLALESVYSLPEDVECMYATFNGCSSLRYVCDLPNNVMDLTATFQHCTALETAPALPDLVTDLHNMGVMVSTFYNCSALREVPKMPERTVAETKYGHEIWSTFYECSSLIKMPKLPEGVTLLGQVFMRCTSLTDVSVGLPESAVELAGTFMNCSSLTETPVISDKIKVMNDTFKNCTALAKIPDVIPYGCEDLTGTFYGCTSLTKAPAIPATVQNMRETFAYCTNLTEISVLAYTEESDLENGVYVEGDITPGGPNDGTRDMGYAFYQCPITESPRIPKGTTNLERTFASSKLRVAPEIPEGVTNMNGTFASSSLVTAGDMPDTVMNADYTYQACYGLKEVGHLSDSITEMKSTFYNCSNITSIENLPKNLLGMDGTFAYCSNLVSVPKVPDSVQYMTSAFQACSKLETFPGIPASATSLYFTYAWCGSLTDISCTIPSTIGSMTATFQNMYRAYGSIEINGEPTNWSSCFGGDTGKNGPGIELYGTSSLLDKIAATGQYVTVRDGY